MYSPSRQQQLVTHNELASREHRGGDVTALLLHKGMSSTVATWVSLGMAERSACGPCSSNGDGSGEIGCSATKSTIMTVNIIPV